MRNMNIDTWCEVQCVIWVKNRILAMGWNKRVTEFADTGEAVGPEGAFRYNLQSQINFQIKLSLDLVKTGI